MSGYNGGNVPSFVSINPTTGVISVAAPNVLADSDYYFNVDSTIASVSSPIQKTIKLTITKFVPSNNAANTWKASNWQKCSDTDSSVCENCNSGYLLSSGACKLVESQTQKSKTENTLAIVNQVIIGVIAVLILTLYIFNITSLSSLWSISSQSQIFFLLFLTGVFIPKEVEMIITGLKVCLNFSDYFSYPINLKVPNFVSNYFDFGLGDSKLELLDIQSDSTAVNWCSFVASILMFIVMNFLVFVLNKLWKSWLNLEKCEFTSKVINWIFGKLVILYTFGIYIRAVMNMNQFILVSSISEIYHFNISNTKRIISYAIAVIVFVIWIFIIWIIAGLVYFQEESKERRNKWAQLFEGIIKEKRYKIFIVYLFIRRLAFVALLITLISKSSFIIICVLILLQIVYMSVLIIKRPYVEVKSNMIEIINETYFVTMLISLLFYNSEEKWAGTPTTAYTWMLASNNIINFMIVFSMKI